jgi:SAM-dependent methyltransferase
VKQKPKNTQISNCPVCEATAFEQYMETKDYFLTLETFLLSKCANCGLVFTNPIPELSRLSAYYDSPDYLSHKVDRFSLKGYVYDKIRDINIRRKYKLVSGYKAGNTILDIGQGTGELMNFFANKGWESVGVEPNPSARAYSEKHFPHTVFDEDHLDNFEPESFDVISLWHVMEHVPDLTGRMNQIKRLLKKEGILVIAVPMLDSPDALRYREFWAGLDVPRHLYHFTKRSMTELLVRNDFELGKTFPMKFDAYYVSMLSEQYKKSSLPQLKALVAGFKSNRAAAKSDNYSSMVFVAKQK